jgi:hypothetical protein
MKRNITIVILSLVVLVQFIYHKVVTEVTIVNIHSSIIAPLQMTVADISDCRDAKILKGKIETFKNGLNQSYRIVNGNTGLFCDIMNAVSELK